MSRSLFANWRAEPRDSIDQSRMVERTAGARHRPTRRQRAPKVAQIATTANAPPGICASLGEVPQQPRQTRRRGNVCQEADARFRMSSQVAPGERRALFCSPSPGCLLTLRNPTFLGSWPEQQSWVDSGCSPRPARVTLRSASMSVLVGACLRCDDWPRLARFKIRMTRLGFRCAVLIPNFVDFVQGSRSGVGAAAIRSHSK